MNYHLSESGPGPCKARVRHCPLVQENGEKVFHGTKEEVEEKFHQDMESKYGLFATEGSEGSFTKNKDWDHYPDAPEVPTEPAPVGQLNIEKKLNSFRLHIGMDKTIKLSKTEARELYDEIIYFRHKALKRSLEAIAANDPNSAAQKIYDQTNYNSSVVPGLKLNKKDAEEFYNLATQEIRGAKGWVNEADALKLQGL